jgi:hypothetical protein
MSKAIDTDYYYALLTEGKLDLMHLPSGAVAWLWQHGRPQEQVDSAAMVGATAYHMDDPVIDAAILRADKNILVLHTQSGQSINVYPDGGLGSNGEPLEADPMSIQAFLSGDTMMGAETMVIDGGDPYMDQADMMGVDMPDMGMPVTGLI